MKTNEMLGLDEALGRFTGKFSMVESSRVTRLQNQNTPAFLVVNDQKTEFTTIQAYMPMLSPANTGHVFITGEDNAVKVFRIEDIFVDPRYRGNQLGSKLMEEALKTIMEKGGRIIKGSFIANREDHKKIKSFFEKFLFRVSITDGKNIKILKILA
jgi:ribosomal protein S18 acetylase RimI-like enzyme